MVWGTRLQRETTRSCVWPAHAGHGAVRGAANHRWRNRLALLTALVLGLGVLPGAANAASSTQTVWVPLACSFGLNVDVGMAVTATLPASVQSGQAFSVTNESVALYWPPVWQNAMAYLYGNPSEIGGVLSDLEMGLSNASSTFVNATNATTVADEGGFSADAAVGTATQVNEVAAVQPPNFDAPSPLDALINGPSPIAGFPDYPEAPISGAWSFGPIAVDGSGHDGTVGGNPLTSAWGPAPGSGGGTTPASGTPDGATIGPFYASSSPGATITFTPGNPSQKMQFGRAQLTSVAKWDLFMAETTGSLAGQWSADIPYSCAIDTTGSAVPSPNPAWANAFTVPIVGGSLPAVTTQPRSTSVTAGQPTTFAAGATGTPTPTVQWQVSTNHGSSFSNVAGATSNRLVVPFTTVGESGYEYRAVFTNAQGVATSNAVTLIVTAPASSTQTVWVPLACSFGLNVDVGMAVTATLPASVQSGQAFSVTNESVALYWPPQWQNAMAYLYGNPSEIGGVLSDLEIGLSNASGSAFVNATNATTVADEGGFSADAAVGTATQVNEVAAVQPPNFDAPSPLDALINGPSPIAGFPDYPEAPISGAWSFGPIAVDGSGHDGTVGGNPLTSAWGPAPGSGGGTTPASGTPDGATIGPFYASSSPGATITFTPGNPSQKMQFGKAQLTPVAKWDLFLFETTGSLANQWSADIPYGCGIDTTATAVPSPNPAWAHAFTIPITS